MNFVKFQNLLLADFPNTKFWLHELFSSYAWYVTLLSHYLCFISFLYLDLNEQEDDSSIRYGAFPRAKHLCVLTHMRTKGQIGICIMFLFAILSCPFLAVL